VRAGDKLGRVPVGAVIGEAAPPTTNSLRQATSLGWPKVESVEFTGQPKLAARKVSGLPLSLVQILLGWPSVAGVPPQSDQYFLTPISAL
jgi:hypothetical protein